MAALFAQPNATVGLEGGVRFRPAQERRPRHPLLAAFDVQSNPAQRQPLHAMACVQGGRLADLALFSKWPLDTLYTDVLPRS